MLCIACSAWDDAALCRSCRSGLRRVAPRRLPCGLLVVAGFRHEAAARRLVHQLKYRGVGAAAAVLAAGLADRLPPGATALVPVPRARIRRLVHGIDPAASLAAELAARTGLPVVPALAASWWWPRHAGRSRSQRRVLAPRFRRVAPLPKGAVLVDDVLTTGATLAAAGAVARAAGAMTATAAGI